jgi:nicotinate phosphoribosyltransferase
MAHDDESEAFSNFLDVFPEQSTLLVDTYDVRAAIDKIIARGRKPRAIRLDSGDVLADSRWARKRLDASGWNQVLIFVSGDLEEDRIEVLLRDGACIDSFGVGTALSTSPDAPSVGVIYKLVEVETDGQVRSTAKFSEEKKTYPGRKQVFRFTGKDGMYSSDVIGLEQESMPGAEALLVPVMRQGRRCEASQQDSITAAKSARERFLTSRSRLPSHLLALGQSSQPFPVHYSARLEELSDQIRQTFVKTLSPAPVFDNGSVQA